MFNSRSVGAGNSYLQFPSYASGEYIKFTAPVAGVYMFELMCSWETHAGGDWLAVGWEKNTTSYGANFRYQVTVNTHLVFLQELALTLAVLVIYRLSCGWTQMIMQFYTNNHAKLSVGDQMKRLR